MRRLLPACAVIAALLASTQPARAQHETGSDVLAGEQAFISICANCHGAAGNLVAGIDLGHGRFRQNYTDDQLQTIILKGIDGKPMPANPTMKPEQAAQLVAYLRSRALVADVAAGGDATRGKALFAGKGNCFACHRIGAQGARLGPDLTAIGVLRPSNALLASLLDPNAEVQANNRWFGVTTKSGEKIEGRLLNQDVFSVQLLDSKERLRSLPKSELSKTGFLPSPMPSLKGVFTEQELKDLVQYLTTLRGDK